MSRMAGLRIACLLALLCVQGFGQGFEELATNRDGSILYFSTPLRQRGSQQYLHPKIFRWDSVNGVALYEQRPTDVPFPTPFPGQTLGSQFFSLVAPDLSSDGSTVAVTGIRFCDFSDICVLQIEEYQSTIYTAGKPTIAVPGTAILSPNGRYVLLRSSAIGVMSPAKMNMLDLQTGQQTAYTGSWQPLGGKRQVANDGTVVLATGGGFSIGSAGQVKTVSAAGLAANPLINDAGTLIIYQAAGATSGTARLSAYSAATGASTDLTTDTINPPDFRPSISADGRLIAFVNGPNRQTSVIHSDGMGLQQITSFPEAVTEVVLSGDGSVAFAVTAANRIVRINIANAQSTDIVPATPYTNVPSATGFQNSFVQGYRFGVSRGTTATIPGAGFAATSQTADPPYPLSLGGVELRVGGIAVPIAGVSPTTISFPATWDLPADAPVDVEVWVSSATASPFVPGFEVEPAPPAFEAATGPPPNLLAAHQNFQSLVTADNPAQPGEYVHVYAKDLGPVIPAPPAGLPAPLQPLSELAVPISCTFGQDTNPNPVPVDVTFAGLAPGLQNIFQVDVHLPPSFQGSPSRLRCQIGYPSLGYTIAGFLAVP